MHPNKYLIMEAETLDARKRHRKLIENLLMTLELSLNERGAAERELQKALVMEKHAQDAANEIEQDETEKGDGDSEGSGDKGGGESRSGESGGRNGNAEDEKEIDSKLETLALLFFLAEHTIEDRNIVDQGRDLDDTIGAATLAFDSDENIAHLQEFLGLETSGDRRSEFLPILERYALEKGAQTLVLKVHQNAVEFYKKKHGYELHRISYKKGNTIHMMRKTLSQKPKIDGSHCV